MELPTNTPLIPIEDILEYMTLPTVRNYINKGHLAFVVQKTAPSLRKDPLAKMEEQLYVSIDSLRDLVGKKRAVNKVDAAKAKMFLAKLEERDIISLESLLAGKRYDRRATTLTSETLTIEAHNFFGRNELICPVTLFLENLRYAGGAIDREAYGPVVQLIDKETRISPRPAKDGRPCYSIDDLATIKKALPEGITIHHSFRADASVEEDSEYEMTA